MSLYLKCCINRNLGLLKYVKISKVTLLKDMSTSYRNETVNRSKKADIFGCLRYNKIKGDEFMGELLHSLNKIWEDTKLFVEIVVLFFGFYMVIQSLNNLELFNYMYVQPIYNFIYTNLIPMFTS